MKSSLSPLKRSLSLRFQFSDAPETILVKRSLSVLDALEMALVDCFDFDSRARGEGRRRADSDRRAQVYDSDGVEFEC